MKKEINPHRMVPAFCRGCQKGQDVRGCHFYAKDGARCSTCGGRLEHVKGGRVPSTTLSIASWTELSDEIPNSELTNDLFTDRLTPQPIDDATMHLR